ncbi:MAG: polysaccharide deacetylase family protein [bacterium]
MSKALKIIIIVLVAVAVMLLTVFLLFVSGVTHEVQLIIFPPTATPLPTITPIPTPTPTPTLTPTPTPDLNNFAKDYDYPPKEQNKGTVRIPVLTYHHVAPIPDQQNMQAYYVTPVMFEKQLQYLKEKNYRTLTTREFLEQVKSGQNPSQKSIVLTFDDGAKNNYDNAFPLLKKYGFVGVFYIPTNKTGITQTQLKEMADAGMEIGSHSKTHPDLSKISDDAKLTDEIINSRGMLQSWTGQDIYSIAYPGCTANSLNISYVTKAGYQVGFSCGKVIDHKYSQRYVLSRIHVYSNLDNFKKILSGLGEFTTEYGD